MSLKEKPIEVKAYCNNELCGYNGQEMRYDISKSLKNTLLINAKCDGCMHSIMIVVKV